MAIKNYTSNSKQTFDKIQKILVAHKAKQIFFDYNEDGKIKAIAFNLEIQGKSISFVLPARVDKVEGIFFNAKKSRYDWQRPEPLNDKEKDQAYRTAWANIRDWIDAQMALIDTEQVKIEQVFLPYMVIGKDKTLFDDFEQKHFQLGSGE